MFPLIEIAWSEVNSWLVFPCTENALQQILTFARYQLLLVLSALFKYAAGSLRVRSSGIGTDSRRELSPTEQLSYLRTH